MSHVGEKDSFGEQSYKAPDNFNYIIGLIIATLWLLSYCG